MDLPVFFDKPAANEGFNRYAAEKGWNVRTDHKMKSTPMWSPRVGFRWNALDNHRLIVRGGAGLFTGRIPFVWLSNNFSNTGVQLSSYQVNANQKASEQEADDYGRASFNPNGAAKAAEQEAAYKALLLRREAAGQQDSGCISKV